MKSGKDTHELLFNLQLFMERLKKEIEVFHEHLNTHGIMEALEPLDIDNDQDTNTDK